MQKNNEFLDKYVEWIAMAVAVLWLAYVGWAYWFSTPVAVTMAGRKYDPATLDPAIKEAATKLDVAMNQPGVPTLDSKNPLDAFAGEMGKDDRASLVYKPLAFFSPGVQDIGTIIEHGPKETIVRELPSPKNFAPPVFLGVAQDRAVVKLPGAGGAPVVPAAAGGAAAPAPGPAAGAPPAANAAQTVDHNWVSLFFNYDPAKIIEEFNRVEVPPRFQNAQILKIEAVREELLPDGKWGNSAPVPPLPLHPELTKFPTAKAEQVIFQRKALENSGLILRPPFYDIAAGNKWRKYSDADPNGATVPVGTGNPKPPPTGTNPPKNGPPKKGPTGLAPNILAPVYFDVNNSAIDRMLLAQAGGVFDPNAAPPAPGAGAAPAPAPAAPPKAEEIWVHDDSVLEGHTYRYRVRVVVYNPMFNTVRLTADPKMAEIFTLPQDANTGWSQWTPPIAVKSHTHFFVGPKTPFPPTKKAIDVTLFQWQGGKMARSILNLNPGDPIGATPWTVVDIKTDGADFLVTFIDDGGRAVTRSWRTDSRSPDLLNLNQQVAPPAAPAAGGAPAAAAPAGAAALVPPAPAQ